MNIKSLFNKKTIAIGLCILVASVVSIQSVSLGSKQFLKEGRYYTHYNNYVIFKQSWHHLVREKDLYQLYPEEHWDYFKYSPTFSLFFGIFGSLPDLPGLILWNILNALILVMALFYLPFFNEKKKFIMFLILLVEMTTSLQNTQSNALLAGLIILAFGMLERKNYLWAVFCIVATIYIKIFGIVAIALFLFYPKKWKLALYSIFWALVFFFIPLVIADFTQLKFLYTSWFNLLKNDHSVSYGISVLGWIKTWFGYKGSDLIPLFAGAGIFFLPLVLFKKYKTELFRLLTLSSILIWVVIFNHKAESPTFVIAMAGVAIWFCSQEFNKWNLALLILALVFTSLSPTDIFPKIVREKLVAPYALKAVPCILIWLKNTYDMIFIKSQDGIIGNP